MKNYDHSKYLSEAKELCEKFKANLPERIDPRILPTNSKLPFKALALREVLLYRMTELGLAACDLYEKLSIVPAILLTRAMMETVAMLYWLYKRLNEVLDTQDLGDIDDFLMSALLGWRDDRVPMKAYNVLTAVNHIDKKYAGFREMYDSLSEFVHPNWCGAHGSYAKIDKENFWVDLGFGIRSESKPQGIPHLSTSLVIFDCYYNELADLLPLFVSICEGEN